VHLARRVIAIRDVALIHEMQKEDLRLANRLLHHGLVNPALLIQHQRHGARQRRLAHRAIASEDAVGPGIVVPPRPDPALPVGQIQRHLANLGQDRLVPGQEVIFGQEDIHVAHVPRGHFIGILDPDLIRVLTHHGKVLGSATGQQAQGVDMARNTSSNTVFLYVPAGIVQDALRLGAIHRGHGTVGTHDLELERDVFGFTLAPADQFQQSTVFGLLSFGDGLPKGNARITIKRLAVNAQNHIIDLQNAVCR
jgi:hypothetical protein